LVVVAVVGASVDVTVTGLESVGPKVELAWISEWPVTVTLSVTDRFSPWLTVKVQDPEPPFAMSLGDGGQVVLFTVPTFPVVLQVPVVG